MDNSISFKNVSHIYQNNTPFAKCALKNINFKIKSGSFISIVGKTGSGKSTLIKHINALLKPTSGEISIGKFKLNSKTNNKNLNQLRSTVGMVFQFPEQQLFADTVEEDIAFGPLNFGYSNDETSRTIEKVVDLVGLDKSLLTKSPFELSGGQQRKVAIADVLATHPKILILDEPTAGLDPQGQKFIMKLISKLNKEKNITIILVSHQMNDVANYSDSIFIMKNGELVKQCHPNELFNNESLLSEYDLKMPDSAIIASLLNNHGFDLNDFNFNDEALISSILKKLRNVK
ncbi:energy-coupling factor transporter ATPase [Apilactobacillus apisilvae]|uniref:Energy-coupling factor transporter ATP-binding protein EcfA2 n=1 Tax=Apilactobacillus apisilvae TaxID=2923364 RepID=A0ABY4PJM6_9LACO|nr:energy-coupling factor transporter ATPase [Apilactobacillus apisilvae]UQS85606.1 energy-coupling factor transporter ATPase [Apilactobacillus apisilvae]